VCWQKVQHIFKRSEVMHYRQLLCLCILLSAQRNKYHVRDKRRQSNLFELWPLICSNINPCVNALFIIYIYINHNTHKIDSARTHLYWSYIYKERAFEILASFLYIGNKLSKLVYWICDTHMMQNVGMLGLIVLLNLEHNTLNHFCTSIILLLGS